MFEEGSAKLWAVPKVGLSPKALALKIAVMRRGDLERLTLVSMPPDTKACEADSR